MSSSPRLSALLDSQTRPNLGVSPLNADQQERFEKLLIEFKEIDSNGDGNLTFDEIFSFLSKRTRDQFPKKTCEELFDRMDRDKNQLISTKEYIQNYIEIEEDLNKRIIQQKTILSDSTSQLEENQRKLVKAETEEEVQKNGIMKDSVLTVQVIEVMKFRLYGVGIYVELYCEGQIIETESRPFDQNPVFKEAFTFKIINGREDLKIHLVDSKTKRKIAGGKYSLNDLKDQFKKDVIVDMLDDSRNHEMIGRAHLELQWIYSRVKYLKDIIVQIEENITTINKNLEELKEEQKNLQKPFAGIFFRPGQSIGNSKDPVSVKITNVFCGIFGRNIRWEFMFNNVFLAYLLISALNMFFVADYLNTSLAALGVVRWTRRSSSNFISLKQYSYILSMTVAYDGIFLLLSGRLLPKEDLHYQYFGVAVTGLLVLFKVMLAALCYKFGSDIH